MRVFIEEFNVHPDVMCELFLFFFDSALLMVGCRFAEFEREPVAAASLAQVHRAVTHDDREVRAFPCALVRCASRSLIRSTLCVPLSSQVAVKVQFPHLREQCEGDVSTIAFLVETMARVRVPSPLFWTLLFLPLLL